MKELFGRLFIYCSMVILAVAARATIRYVDANGTNPVSPYTDWSTAATNIQDAVNVASFSDIVLVTNGLYQYGGSSGSRVYLSNPSVTIQSVNGPTFTTIQGYQVPGTTNGSTAIRCVYMAGGTLSGFTLTNGATTSFGSGGGVYCTSQSCVVTNCIIADNAGLTGAGAYSGKLINCRLQNNFAMNTGWGGGAYLSMLIDCIIAGNRSDYRGAAVYNCGLNGCILVTNVGGITCVESSQLTNCISYYNSPDNGEGGGYFSYCCTALTPANGTNNVISSPGFVDLAGGDYHLSQFSRCINAGRNASVIVSNDFDGNPRIVYGTVDIGAYESSYNPNFKVHYVSLDSTNPISPFNDWSVAATNIQDAVDAALDGESIYVTNGIYKYGGRTASGYSLTNRVAVTKAVILQSINGAANTFIQGVSPVGNTAVRCVYLTNGAVLIGFTLTNGATLNLGNTTYQQSGGGVLCESTKALVTNCVIVGCAANNGGGAAGGTLNACAIIRNTASYGGGIFGTNSAWSTLGGISNMVTSCIIVSNSATSHGGGAFGSTLNNCFISSNSVGLYTGGGAAYSFLNNCIVSNNAAPNYYGGGVSYSVLTNCLLIRNRSSSDGGGAYYSLMSDCTVASNSVMSVSGIGGGTYQGTNYNCIVYYNSSPSSSNYYNSVSAYCDTMPLAAGTGNITNAPVFVNASAGNFHLQSTSPCINSGYNAYILVTNDLDGNPRIVGGTVDMGAYEYQTPASVISYAWLQQYGLATDGSADYADTDGTGMNNWQKWIAGLNPTNSSSVLAMLAPAATNTSNGITVTWQSVNTRTYFLQRSSDLSAQPPFSTTQSNIVGQAGTTSYTDSAATNNVPYFYRVGVQ